MNTFQYLRRKAGIATSFYSTFIFWQAEVAIAITATATFPIDKAGSHHCLQSRCEYCLFSQPRVECRWGQGEGRLDVAIGCAFDATRMETIKTSQPHRSIRVPDRQYSHSPSLVTSCSINSASYRSCSPQCSLRRQRRERRSPSPLTLPSAGLTTPASTSPATPATPLRTGAARSSTTLT